MHKPESVQETDTHEILGDFELQMDYQITARRSDQVINNIKQSFLCHPSGPQSKIKGTEN